MIKQFGKNRSDVWHSGKCSTVEGLTVPLITSFLGVAFLIYENDSVYTVVLQVAVSTTFVHNV